MLHRHFPVSFIKTTRKYKKKNFLAASLGVPGDHPRFINDLLYENQEGKSIAQRNTLLMLLEVYTLDMLLINLQIFEWVPSFVTRGTMIFIGLNMR